ncbi:MULTISPECIES: hypothetical protein [unclassified Phycicoccus]|uniref:hypothetical protein n=1 Tax=unclassified Phycicoccus TaxID=2637926 RepID=UPI00070286CD|nr:MULTISPECIES: hypothetical protein [unclassified Phycicoccus]KQU67503.1 hypothetical protein ASC58_13160 [Phycicoccus sp. Root101]KQZ90181.1 hypothetical protein ASD62_13620 [Phycicoccus sp. Root563]
MSNDWSTPEGIAAIKDALAATIEGWVAPVAYGVGISPASSSPEREFPHVNGPGGTHGLPAVVLAKIVGHAHGTQTYDLSRAQVEAAVETLAPAEACTSMDHPNLAALRTVLAELESNPAREAQVVFVGDLDDPVSSEADATLRTLVQS